MKGSMTIPYFSFFFSVESLGPNVRLLLDRPDGVFCFRLHRDRVFYVSEDIMLRATNFARKNLVTLGCCMGKFSKKGKFRLHVTALHYLAPYAKYKVAAATGPGGGSEGGVGRG